MASLELVPLATVDLTLDSPFTVGPGPLGNRVIGEVRAATIKGDRINGSMKGAAAADWLLIDAAGTLGTIDVRIAFETDDGALICASYKGRLDFTTMSVVVAPLFETGDERYAWLNRIQAVGRGTFVSKTEFRYEWFEARPV